MKKSARRLHLCRETLRRLDEELVGARGGAGATGTCAGSGCAGCATVHGSGCMTQYCPKKDEPIDPVIGIGGDGGLT